MSTLDLDALERRHRMPSVVVVTDAGRTVEDGYGRPINIVAEQDIQLLLTEVRRLSTLLAAAQQETTALRNVAHAAWWHHDRTGGFGMCGGDCTPQDCRCTSSTLGAYLRKWVTEFPGGAPAEDADVRAGRVCTCPHFPGMHTPHGDVP